MSSPAAPHSELQLGGVPGRFLADENLYGFRAGDAAELAHQDDADSDFRSRILRLKPDQYLPYIEKHLRISPHSPVARYHLVRTDWEKAAAQAAAWEKEFAGHPVLLSALARKYRDLKRHDDAERLYRAVVKLSPENLFFYALVAIYRMEKKDQAKVLEFMEERFQYPDYGLDHAGMRVRIAAVYSLRKDYRTALKYAEQAAIDSGAEWAMTPAIRYAGLVGDKAKAAMWEERRRAV